MVGPLTEEPKKVVGEFFLVLLNSITVTRLIALSLLAGYETVYFWTAVNLLMNLFFTAKYIGKKAVLLAVRPLKVGSKKLTKHFHRYEPAKK